MHRTNVLIATAFELGFGLSLAYIATAASISIENTSDTALPGKNIALQKIAETDILNPKPATIGYFLELRNTAQDIPRTGKSLRRKNDRYI